LDWKTPTVEQPGSVLSNMSAGLLLLAGRALQEHDRVCATNCGRYRQGIEMREGSSKIPLVQVSRIEQSMETQRIMRLDHFRAIAVRCFSRPGVEWWGP
jgi:hypothetical protein